MAKDPKKETKNSLTVMLIEQEGQTVHLFRQALGTNYRICSVLNGEAGMRGANTGQADIIFIHDQLPDTTGIEVCRRLRAQHKFDDVPIIMIFSQFSAETIRICYDAGADSYLTRPLEAHGIKSQVEVFLAEKE